MKDGYYYCVAVPGTPTSRTSSMASTTPPADRPTQTGIASNCGQYWLVSTYVPTSNSINYMSPLELSIHRSDTCDTITAFNNITLSDFLSWNPSVGTTSCSNLVPDYYVCVGLSSSSSTTSASASSTQPPSSTTTPSSTTRSSSSTTGGGSVVPTPTPTPTQVIHLVCAKMRLLT